VRRLWIACVGLAVAALASPAAAAPGGAPDNGIPVVPVQGKALGNGVRLFVDVFYAKGSPGPPGGGGGGGGGSGSVNCTDNNAQTGFSAPFAGASALTMHVNESTVPSGLSVNSALSNAASQWNSNGAHLSVTFTGSSETTPTQNGISTIGWVKIVPKNVLAATWTYVNASNHIIEADLFYNSIQPWTVLNGCPTTATGRFDVGDIGTHEMGHVLGLSHFSDSGSQATMYPSAPPDEVRKITLTAGDKAALQASLGL
jgi:matrixin